MSTSSMRHARGSVDRKAALSDQMQRSINLCLGAFVSTVGMTVPMVLAFGLFLDVLVVLGLGSIEKILIALTIALTAVTFHGSRTSKIQGVLHLALFIGYMTILAQQ